MAKNKTEQEVDPTQKPEFSEKEMNTARKWFKKAGDLRERRDYDYAIECFISGLAYWPEAVEEGHMPLRSLSIQRQQAGGKKPGMMDGFKRSMSGKDYKKAMLNAEQLLAMDPQNASYAEGVLKNAGKAGLLETARWVAPIVYDNLRKEKKPSKSKFKTFRDEMVAAADKADIRGEGALETFFMEQAVQSLEFLISRNPGDEDLKNEQRNLAGKLTIARGKYDDAEDFRDSLRDADKQKLLHDSERLRQGEDTLEALINARKKEYEEDPDTPAKLNAYVDALLKTETRQREAEAIDALMTAYQRSKSYSFKLRADDIRLMQMKRDLRKLVGKARKTRDESDLQQARLAAAEYRQTTIDVMRERVDQYPTDLRLKFRLGEALFEAGEYDEAIPVLQEARNEPRNRARSQLLIGRAFFEKGNPAQAAQVLEEALSGYELTDDHSKNLLYWLGRSYEEDGQIPQAKDFYGKLLRQDYNFMDGDARKRLDEIVKKEKELKGQG